MKHNLSLWFWIHLVLIVFMWASPFWLNWKILGGLIFLYYLQLILFGDCIFIKKQYNSKKREITIYTQILENLNFKVNRKMMVFLSDYVFPWIIIGLALIYQLR